jgi:hypothetical protein
LYHHVEPHERFSIATDYHLFILGEVTLFKLLYYLFDIRFMV